MYHGHINVLFHYQNHMSCADSNVMITYSLYLTTFKYILSKQNVAIIPDLNVRAHRSANNVILAHSVTHNLYTAHESLSLASQALDS